jgi:hypothetical protein
LPWPRYHPDQNNGDVMATRPYWKGYLKLSLVTCPVALYPASSQSEKLHFHQINRKTGNHLRQQMVDERTGKVVDKDEKGRGYELAKGKYVEIEPQELDAVEVEATHTIDIDKFVPAKEIDRRYYDKPYYIAPNGKSGVEAFAVICDGRAPACQELFSGTAVRTSAPLSSKMFTQSAFALLTAPQQQTYVCSAFSRSASASNTV